MFSNKTPKDIFIKLVEFFQKRKANKYKSQIDQDSSDFQEFVKAKIQNNTAKEFDFSIQDDKEVDIDQELSKLGVTNIDEIEEDAQISTKLRNFIKNVKKKLKLKFEKTANLHPQDEKNPRSQPNIIPVKVIKNDLTNRVRKNQAVAANIAQRIASTAAQRDAARAAIQKNLASKDVQKDAGNKLAITEKLGAEKQMSAKLRDNKSAQREGLRDMNLDGKIDGQDKNVKDSDKQKDLHIKIRADAINNIGENPAKSEWVGAVSDTAVKGKGDGGRSV
jgi:hypothetical protein